VLISVPKRQFKKAHDRNYVKRCIREILRKNKDLIQNRQQPDNNKIVLSVVYNYNQLTTFVEMEQKLVKALQMLSSKLKQ
jgi:ribonuclease P protein component